MPFCRKCGRRLPEYSESCPECKTSTTAPLIKIKKAQAAHPAKTVTQDEADERINPGKPVVISIEVFAPKKAAKTVVSPKAASSAKPSAPPKPAKTVASPNHAAFAEPIIPIKPAAHVEVQPEHEILQSNTSLKEDLLKNPKDYEKQTFDYDLKCINNHLWPAGEAVPVSNRKALCLKCGEQLRAANQKRRRRFRSNLN